MAKYSSEMTFSEKAAFFATGRAGVRKVAAGPDLHFATRYRPTIGGRGVCPSDMPPDGYETRDSALAGAQQFKRASAAVL